MDELGEGLQIHIGEFFLDKILHGFHIVVGHPLDILDPLRIVRGKLPVDVFQRFEPMPWECFNWGSGSSQSAMK